MATSLAVEFAYRPAGANDSCWAHARQEFFCGVACDVAF